jgi:GR25 family glycosyltransferase involved in LPS biosynthesis
MEYKVLVINLERNPERLSFMREQFQKIGIGFERFPAIEGSKYNFNLEYPKLMRVGDNNGVFQPLGVIGCALSHKKALELIVKSEQNFGLIMEDDVEVSPDFKIIIEKEIRKRKNNHTSWEYLTFNYPTPGWKSIALWLFLVKRHFLKNSRNITMWLKLPVLLIKFLIVSCVYVYEGLRNNLFKIFNLGKPVKFYRDLYLAGCYLVTQEGAKKLISMNDELMYTADELPNVARKKNDLKFYAYVPHVARQKREDFPSILTGGQDFGKKIISY